VWLQQRHRELASLDAITTALRDADTVTGAGAASRCAASPTANSPEEP